MWGVDDQHIGPLDEPFENLPRVSRLQIESQSPLVAIVQVPGIVILGARLRRDLVSNPPQIARGRFDLDHISAKVGQDDRCTRTRDEAREIDDLET